MFIKDTATFFRLQLAKVNCRGSYDPPANFQCAKYIESINNVSHSTVELLNGMYIPVYASTVEAR